MRWKPIGERELPNWAGFILVVPFMIVLSPVLLLMWIEQEWRRRYGPRAEWSEWFAWHPVRSDSGFGKTVWLETVQRRQWYGQVHHRTMDEARSKQ